MFSRIFESNPRTEIDLLDVFAQGKNTDKSFSDITVLISLNVGFFILLFTLHNAISSSL